MNIYTLLKIYRRIKSPRLKLLGILALHLSGRRYINVFLDPVRGCNLRCQMCYFSDPETRKEMHGSFSAADLEAIARSLFHRTMKLQIGCGAEPTVSNNLVEIVKTAKREGVPYVSITTNGNLLTKEKLEELQEAGLDELTISAHGFTKSTYEYLMTNGRFDKFLDLLDSLRAIRKDHPEFNIRLNYTINEDNVAELPLIKEVFEGVYPNEIQLRPIQKLGKSAYSNFSLDKIISGYDEYIQPVADFCSANNIVCIYPTKENLERLQVENTESESHVNKKIDSLIYVYLSPYVGWQKELNPYTETFEDYCKRTHLVSSIVKEFLATHHRKQSDDGRTKMLNYDVK